MWEQNYLGSGDICCWDRKLFGKLKADHCPNETQSQVHTSSQMRGGGIYWHLHDKCFPEVSTRKLSEIAEFVAVMMSPAQTVHSGCEESGLLRLSCEPNNRIDSASSPEKIVYIQITSHSCLNMTCNDQNKTNSSFALGVQKTCW